MKSPFPGMDPYLEATWPDVQISLVYLAKTALQPQLLKNDLVARSGARETPEFLQRYVEIFTISGRRTITTIEFVAPVNKSTSGREQYRQRQQECIDAGINLVEIDLTRSGQREVIAHRRHSTHDADSTYQVSVWRAPKIGALFQIKLQDRLPTIGIPLRDGDEDARLNLQALIDGAYEASAYGRTIDYARDPQPPLADEDAAWADELLRAAGKRL
jgi:hypothetical protein